VVQTRMKKLFLLLSLFISMLSLAASAQDSLADVARKARANRHTNPSTQVIDNDMIPAALPSAPPAEKAKGTDTQPDVDKKGQPKKDATQADKKGDAKDQDKPLAAGTDQKKTEDLKKQVDDQRKEITQLQRELDVVEREARLRAAAYYADAGAMLRDQGKFLEESRQQQAEIDTKKQAIADAKLKLDDLQEQARKAGIEQQ
jgi:hypothetical protein